METFIPYLGLGNVSQCIGPLRQKFKRHTPGENVVSGQYICTILNAEEVCIVNRKKIFKNNDRFCAVYLVKEGENEYFVLKLKFFPAFTTWRHF